MPFLQIDITTYDLENLNWEEILQDVDEIVIHKFASRFDELSDKFHEKGEENNASIMALVSAMCKVALKTDPNDVSFKEKVNINMAHGIPSFGTSQTLKQLVRL